MEKIIIVEIERENLEGWRVVQTATNEGEGLELLDLLIQQNPTTLYKMFKEVSYI